MLENKEVTKNLQKTQCPRCGATLEGAKLIPISEVPFGFVAHVVCPLCKTESMVTITTTGGLAVQVESDLTGSEFKKFMTKNPVSLDEVLNLHKTLKKESLWNLLQKKGKYLENKQKA